MQRSRNQLKSYRIVLIGLLLAATARGETVEDARQRVELPPQVQAHMLANMRDHLAAIEAMTRLLAERRYEEAADTAETRLGMSAMAAHGAQSMAPFMPEPMRAMGGAMHRAASRFATEARNTEVTGDPSGALGALSAVMQQCVACHGAFRVH